MANVAYDFARYVRAAMTSGLTEDLDRRAREVEDVALQHIVAEFGEDVA